MQTQTLQCEACNGDVSSSFARVFGSQDGTVYACPDCETMESIKNGAATDPETTSLKSDLARSASEQPTDSDPTDTAEASEESDESPTDSKYRDRDGSPAIDPNPIDEGGTPSADTQAPLTTSGDPEKNSEPDEAAFEALLG